MEVAVERRLITTDCHIAPPFSLFDELPDKYRDHFPHIEHRDDGDYLVRPERKLETMGAAAQSRAKAQMARGRNMAGGGEIKLDDERAGARLAVGNVCDPATPSNNPKEQLAELERDGVYGAVLIGRFGGFDMQPLDADLAYCQLVNDYLADTWRPYYDRVAPGIHLPLQDIDASVKELERAAGMGLRPALMPDGIFDRPYYLEEWEPIWEACNSLNVPITMHVGSRLVPAALERGIAPGEAYIGWYNQCVGMGETLGWLTFSGVFERYPDLHVIMTAGYAAWLTFAIQFWDHHWVDSRYHDMVAFATGPAAAKIEAPPSYYLKRNAHATFMWDPVAIREREVTGMDCLLWGNDYPHREGSFPDSQQWVEKQFTGVPEDEIDYMVRGNAARIFGFTV
jgi:predicted TIM-barrel fold metal-dependent hydrolase